MPELGLFFGLPEEQKAFAETHADFLKVLPKLQATIDRVFFRTSISRGPADGVVYQLGRLCAEDFNEILLLCGNGYGIGGLKLLRGFYERVVTMAYISKNVGETDQFLGYYPIHKGKELIHLKAFLAGSSRNINEFISEEEISDIEQKHSDAKDKYENRFQWSKLDILSMAMKVGLEGLYFTCYYLPLQYTHPTFSSITRQLMTKKDAASDAIYDPAAQRDAVNLALQGAHCLMLQTLGTQNEFFGLDINDDCLQDFTMCWSQVPLLIR